MEFLGAFNQESGFEMTHKAMANSIKTDGDICHQQLYRHWELKALQELGLRVPEDVAVVGFDDLPPALVTFPFLTVAAQPAYRNGQESDGDLIR